MAENKEEMLVCPQCEEDASDTEIAMHSGVSLRAGGTGFVHLAWGKNRETGLRVQLSPDEIRHHAFRLIEGATVAETDAAIFRFGISMGMKVPDVGQMLKAVRAQRDESREP